MSNINNEHFISFKNRDIYLVLINLLIVRIFSRFPSIFPKTSGNAAALSALWSGFVAFGVIFLITELCSRNKTANLIVAAHRAFGKWGGYIVSAIVTLCLFVSAVITLGELSQLAKDISFPTAPFWFVLLFFAVAAVCGVFGGIGAISRMHGFFVPTVIVVLVLLILSVVFSGDATMLFPILGNGAEAVFGKGLSGTILYTDILLFFLICPGNNIEEFTKKKVLTASAIGIFLSVMFIFALNLSVSPSVSAEGSFPVYHVLKEVYYGRFFQRIDAIMLLISSLSGMLYLSLNVATLSLISKEIFKTDRVFLISVAYMFFITVFAFLSNVFSSKILGYLTFVLGFGGIAVVTITMLFARRKFLNEKN